MTRELVVTEGAAGTRLDVYLTTQLGVSRSVVQRYIKRDEVTVGGQSRRANYLVEAGDKVAVNVVAAVTPHHQPPDLTILYQDDDLLVVDKPAGIAVHPGNGRDGEATVADFARLHTADPDPDRPGIVHRLDRDTSGLLVIAKTVAAREYLQQLWRDRQVQKTYQLLTVGRVEPAEAVINMPLDRDPANPLRRHVSVSGRPAATRYRTLAVYPGYSHIEAYPETGRTHQLRVHFAAIGHPIVGDTLYGAPRQSLGLKRQFLHAAALSFVAPSGHKLELTSPLPTELLAVLHDLDKTV